MKDPKVLDPLTAISTSGELVEIIFRDYFARKTTETGSNSKYF